MADEDTRNIKYVTNFLYENNGSVYGLEVLLYSEDENLIDKLIVVNESEFDSWTTMVDNLSSAYIPFTTNDLENIQQIKEWKEEYNNGNITWDTYQANIDDLEWSNFKTIGESIEKILRNEETELQDTYGNSYIGYPFEINATKFMGLESDDFSKANHTHNYAVKNHALNKDTYGLGTNSLYGHTKVINKLTSSSYKSGESLSAYQGKILNDKITTLTDKNTWVEVNLGSSYINCKVNEFLQLIVIDYNRPGYTGLANTTGLHELHGAGTIPSQYLPSSKIASPMYRGDVVLDCRTDGSIKVYNLTKVKNITLSAQLMWKY